jgi:hypothetical protein
MTNIYFQDKQKDFEQIKIELQKAKLEIEPEYSFEFMGWKFSRTRRRWDVETTSNFGFTKEQGMILHNTPFPTEYFDEPMNTIYGHYIRLAGHAGCPSPDYENGLWLEEDKCVLYHIDNQCSFNFFVKCLNDFGGSLA